MDWHLNGFRIFAAVERRDGEWIIAGHNPRAATPYVTARWRPTMGEEWWQGHYLHTRSEAWEDLKERAA